MKLHYMIFAAAVAALSAPAGSQTPVQVGAFEALELQGGGRVLVRHAPVQRVTLINGSLDHSSIELGRRERRGARGADVDTSDRLVIEACRGRCPPNYRLEVLVETPNLAALAVSGGGDILMQGAFPRQGSVAVAANGGGRIDARALPARSVSASANGGGTLLVRPDRSLAAAVRGGGSVRYWGDPEVMSAISGGGSVQRGR